MSIEFLGFTLNFVIEGDIQKIDVNIKIILEGLFPVFALSINSTNSNPWILESGATDNIISKASVMTEPKATTISTINYKF